MSVARSPQLPPEPPRWYETPAFRRIALAIGGAALAALCPILPPPANAVCAAVVQLAPVVSQALAPLAQDNGDGGSPWLEPRP